MTATNLAPDVVAATDAALDQLVIDLNKGTDGGYRIEQTRTYSARVTTDTGNGNAGWATNTNDSFKVVYRANGVSRDIATLYIRDGEIRHASIDRDVAFRHVPRVLRDLAS